MSVLFFPFLLNVLGFGGSVKHKRASPLLRVQARTLPFILLPAGTAHSHLHLTSLSFYYICFNYCGLEKQIFFPRLLAKINKVVSRFDVTASVTLPGVLGMSRESKVTLTTWTRTICDPKMNKTTSYKQMLSKKPCVCACVWLVPVKICRANQLLMQMTYCCPT